MKQKIGLALSGGAVLGFAHIGVLKALEESGHALHAISGNSAGAIVAACYAFGVSAKELEEKALKLKIQNLYRPSYSSQGLVSSEPVGKLITEIIGKKNIEDAKIPLAIVATNMFTGKRHIFTKGSVADAVMASVSIPGIFPPKVIDNIPFVDGCIVEDFPVSVLKKLGATTLVGVNLAKHRTFKPAKNGLGVILNSFIIMTHHQNNTHAKLADYVIAPKLEDFSLTDFKKITPLIKAGYVSARSVFKKIV